MSDRIRSRTTRTVLGYDRGKVMVSVEVSCLPRRLDHALEALRGFPAHAEVNLTAEGCDGWLDIWWTEDATPEEIQADRAEREAREAEKRDRAEFEAWKAQRRGPAAGGSMSAATCVRCGSECEGTSGYSRPDGTLAPLCHEGPSPTCYELHGSAPRSVWQFPIAPEDVDGMRSLLRSLGAHHDQEDPTDA
ncbi:hypothetical protein PO878_04050 [Iamia majanohamensis]|uniref:Uncharacterized protein n=1 Tax=Iamia majanohamensis TaxID=467976 RepID=A0AAE9Y6M6_9ACTN|nr:hypothetical protein [Iamia majanohamensis]WCO67895.1 hypothetical protein PO878_04050 [Iamia majanohamensis]